MAKVRVARETIDWLLAEDNPPVRYLTLTQLLGRPERGRDVVATRRRLGDYGPTKKILARHQSFWKRGDDLYAYYVGGYWQLIFLGDLHAPRRLPEVRRGVELILDRLDVIPKDRPLWGIHCLNANLLRAMVGLGFGADPRVRAGLDLIAKEVTAANGVPCAIIDWSVYPTCSMSLPKVLLALTALPAEERSRKVKRAIKVVTERLIDNRIHHYVSKLGTKWYDGDWKVSGLPEPVDFEIVRNPEYRARIIESKTAYVSERGGLGERSARDGWDRFGFPNGYDSDVLEAMRALVAAKAPKRADGLQGAVELILDKRHKDGRWRLEASHNGAMLASIERKGQASRWLTLHALTVLQYFRGLDIEG